MILNTHSDESQTTNMNNALTIAAIATLSLPCAGVTAAESNPGDRNLPINQVYPEAAFYHNGGRVLDVTKPPFNARGDGVTDDTKALCAAMRFVRENTEIPKGDCGPSLKQSWTIYLPNGEYLVSDTVSQGWPAQGFRVVNNDWRNVERFAVDSPDDPRVRYEDNWFIRMVGQNRDRTIIRLKDESPGFGKGADKAVVQFHLLGYSNVNQGNYFENIAIDAGRGNPGAVGLKWNGSNWGGVRNVRVRSGDGQGRAGLMMDTANATGYFRDLDIQGFDAGIELGAGSQSMVVLEHATLSGQRLAAIQVRGGRGRFGPRPISARKVLVRDAPVACKVGRSGHLVLLESALRNRSQNLACIEIEKDGHLFAREVDVSGYEAAVVRQGEAVLKGGFVSEYVSDEPASLRADVPARSMRLPAKDAPVCLPEPDLSQWASVDDFGALGDGIHDDTAAIQKAVNSGKPVVWFPKATYVINGTVDIPATVREMVFLWASVYRTGSDSPDDGPAMFRVAEPSLQPLFLHRNHNAGGIFLDHEAYRPVVFEDVIAWFHHDQWRSKIDGVRFPLGARAGGIWRSYRNTSPEGEPKEIFASSLLHFAAGGTDAQYAVENVRAWIRMVNNEHLPGAQIAFRRSEVWVLGFKIEAAETLFQVEEGSRLEVLGGNYLNFQKREETPMIVSRDSQISMLFSIYGGGVHHSTLLHERTRDQSTTIGLSRFLQAGQGENDAVIPLLVNTLE